MRGAELIQDYDPIELRPDLRAETELQDIRDVTRLALAESPHPLTRRGLRGEVRDRLDARVYKRSLGRVDTVIDQEGLCSTMDELAFRRESEGARFRLTDSGLRILEEEKVEYRRKCSAAAHDLAAAAVEHVPQLRPGADHTRIALEGCESGPAVVWTNSRLGLMRYDRAGLLVSEAAALPDGHKGFGTLHLVMRRLELHLGVDGHAEELLVFNYPKGDPDHGRRVYEGRETPAMHAEIRRERVPLGVLRQLTAEFGDPARMVASGTA